MNKTPSTFDAWSGFSASIPGSGHIRRGLPCQDASAVVQTPRPMLIVCDGCGSASRSQDGAAGAVRAFKTQCAIFEPMLSSILNSASAAPERWEMFCRILYRTLWQVQVDLAAEHGIPEKEFDFTVAAAVAGTHWIGCFQVGDGSIVLRQNGIPVTAFLPDKGEYANQTHFLRKNGEAHGQFHGNIFPARENSGIAITSDGPEFRMFHLKNMTPAPIFSHFFDDLQNGNLTKQDIMDYLTRRDWDNDPRGSDDRSIAILAPNLKSCTCGDQKVYRSECRTAPSKIKLETGKSLFSAFEKRYSQNKNDVLNQLKPEAAIPSIGPIPGKVPGDESAPEAMSKLGMEHEPGGKSLSGVEPAPGVELIPESVSKPGMEHEPGGNPLPGFEPGPGSEPGPVVELAPGVESASEAESASVGISRFLPYDGEWIPTCAMEPCGLD